MEINCAFFVFYFFLVCGLFKQRILIYAQQDYMGGELNHHCAAVNDCRQFGYVCRESSCQCDQWYIPDKEKKKCVGGVDQKCLYDEHCINGAYCMNQSICKCKISSSQPLDHGLVCAGVSDLSKHRSFALTFLVIGVIINKFRNLFT